MFYMIIASIACALEAAGQGGAANSIMLFSLLITYGCKCSCFSWIWPFAHQLIEVYALSSLLALDPWHMITSFIPYIFLSPTYVNILNVFVSSCLFSNSDMLTDSIVAVMHFRTWTM